MGHWIRLFIELVIISIVYPIFVGIYTWIFCGVACFLLLLQQEEYIPWWLCFGILTVAVIFLILLQDEHYEEADRNCAEPAGFRAFNQAMIAPYFAGIIVSYLIFVSVCLHGNQYIVEDILWVLRGMLVAIVWHASYMFYVLFRVEIYAPR